MQKRWILGLALLSCTAGLQAEPQAAEGKSVQAASQDPNETTIEGCLQRTGWQYTVTERDGTQMPIAGYPKISQYIGHDVEMTGKQISKSVDTTSAGAGSSVVMRAEFKMKSVKDLGVGCSPISR